MPNWAAYEEASKRGILPPDKMALYQEAIKRGLAPGPEGGAQPMFQGGQPKPLRTQFQSIKPLSPGVQWPSGEQAYEQKFSGQPMPEDPGSFAETPFLKKALGFGIPVATDIAATLMAPQQGGKRLAIRGANLAKRSIASGFGSYKGSQFGQTIEKGRAESGEAGKEAAMGFLGEGVIGGLGRPAKWAAEKVAKPIAQLMSAITASSMKVTKAMKDNMVKKSTTRALKFVEDLAPDVVKRQDVNLGSIGAMVESAVSEKRAMYDFYENILTKHAEKSGGLIELPETMNLVSKVRKEIAGMAGEKPFARTTLNVKLKQKFGYAGQSDFGDIVEALKPLGTEGGSISVDPKAITNILATVFKKGKQSFHKLPSETIKNLRIKLKEAMLNDLSKIQGKVEGKTALQAKQEADEMTKALAQFQFIKGLFDQSTAVGKFSTDVRLAPNKIADMIEANKTRIERDMPDLWPKLKAEADYYKSVAHNFSEVGLQKSDAFRAVGTGVGIALPGSAMVGIPIVEGMGAASAYFLMSPKAQKALKKIIYGSIKMGGKAGVHMGGRQINFPERGR